MASLHVTSLGRVWPLASALFTRSTVEDHPHVLILVGAHIPDIHVRLWLGARHDEEQVCHARLRRDSLQNGRPVDAGHSAQCTGRLSGQKTPRPERRKADTLTLERPIGRRARSSWTLPLRALILAIV